MFVRIALSPFLTLYLYYIQKYKNKDRMLKYPMLFISLLYETNE